MKSQNTEKKLTEEAIQNEKQIDPNQKILFNKENNVTNNKEKIKNKKSFFRRFKNKKSLVKNPTKNKKTFFKRHKGLVIGTGSIVGIATLSFGVTAPFLTGFTNYYVIRGRVQVKGPDSLFFITDDVMLNVSCVLPAPSAP